MSRTRFSRWENGTRLENQQEPPWGLESTQSYRLVRLARNNIAMSPRMLKYVISKEYI